MKSVDAAAETRRSQRTSASRWLLPVLLTVAIVVIGIQLTKPAKSGDVAPPFAPPLRAVAASCSHPVALARDVAEQRERVGRLRWERASIDPTAAPAARSDLALAAACYRTAGDGAAADRVADALLAYGRAMERDRRHQQLRLRIALERGDHAAALDSVSALRALLHDLPEGTYMRWLATVERDVEMKVGAR